MQTLIQESVTHANRISICAEFNPGDDPRDLELGGIFTGDVHPKPLIDRYSLVQQQVLFFKVSSLCHVFQT